MRRDISYKMVGKEMAYQSDGLSERWPIRAMAYQGDGLSGRWPIRAMAYQSDGLSEPGTGGNNHALCCSQWSPSQPDSHVHPQAGRMPEGTPWPLQSAMPAWHGADRTYSSRTVLREFVFTSISRRRSETEAPWSTLQRKRIASRAPSRANL